MLFVIQILYHIDLWRLCQHIYVCDIDFIMCKQLVV